MSIPIRRRGAIFISLTFPPPTERRLSDLVRSLATAERRANSQPSTAGRSGVKRGLAPLYPTLRSRWRNSPRPLARSFAYGGPYPADGLSKPGNGFSKNASTRTVAFRRRGAALARGWVRLRSDDIFLTILADAGDTPRSATLECQSPQGWPSRWSPTIEYPISPRLISRPHRSRLGLDDRPFSVRNAGGPRTLSYPRSAGSKTGYRSERFTRRGRAE